MLSRSDPARLSSRAPLLPCFRVARRAVAQQAIEMHADVGGFCRRVGERDGAVERDAGLVIAAELHQEGAADAEVMEIIR